MKQPLTLILFLLLASGAVSAQSGTQTKNYASTPSGEGDPDAITCRPPQALPGSRLLGPEVCRPNAVWARYRKDGMDVAADGIHDIPMEKLRSINPRFCRPATAAGNNTSGMNQMNFSMICD